jgi:predicted ester cyclase
MSNSRQKETSRHVLQLWASQSPVLPEDVVCSDYKNHQMPDVEGGTSCKSLQEWKTLLESFHNSFSDVTVDVLLQVEEGHYVATRWQLNATHTAEFAGFPASGKRVSWTGVHTDRHESGKVAESWVEWDKYRFLEELGFLTSVT